MTKEIALHCMKSYSELHSDLCELCPIYGQTGSDHCFEDALQYVIGMLEQEPTSKNDLVVDCISRAQAQTKIEMNASRYTIARERGGIGQVEWSDQLIKVSDAVNILRELPSVAPQLSSGLENSTKKYCGCCKHWKRKGVKKIGDKPTSYGKCTKLSISGFEVETTFNDECSSEGLE